MKKYTIEHKHSGKGFEYGERWLVLETTNPYPTDNPLHFTYLGRVVAECPAKEDADLVLNSLNENI